MLYDNPLLERINQISIKNPDKKIILETSGKSISSYDLLESMYKVSQNLSELGFKKGDRVLLLVRPGIDLTIIVLSVFTLGGVVVVSDPGMGKQIFQNRMKLAKPKWIFVEPILYAIQPHPVIKQFLRKSGNDMPEITKIKNAKIIRVGIPLPGTFGATSFNDLLQINKKESQRKLQKINNNSKAIIVFTSGTTNFPKGVVHTIASLNSSIDKIEQVLKPSHNDKFYAALAQFLFLAIGLGVTVIVPSKSFSGKHMLEDIEKFQPTVIFGPPSEIVVLMNYCKSLKIKIPNSINTIILGSAPVLTGMLNKLDKYISKNTSVLCMYGMTEIIPVAYVYGNVKQNWKGKGDLLGTFFKDIQYKIAEDGELLIKGDNLFRNYLGFPKAIWAASGDLVKIVNGKLVLMSRKKDMIIKDNYNIYPSLYEPIIQSIPGVEECALIGICDKDLEDEKIILVIQPENKLNSKIISIVSNSIRSGKYSIDTHAFPDKIISMELPKIGRQKKIDKNKLREIIIRNYL